MKTEDDTFNALRRPTYDEMVTIVAKASCINSDEWNELFHQNRWTIKEYNRIRDRRYDEQRKRK